MSLPFAGNALGLIGKIVAGGAAVTAGAVALRALNNNANFSTNYGDNLNTGLANGYTPDNPNYITIIKQVGSDKDVVGTAPLEFDLSIQNNFIDLMTLFEATTGGSGAGTGRGAAIATGIASAAGAYNQSRIASFKVWGGTTPLQFPLTISFKAFRDPLKEVIEPVRNLLFMASPQGAGPFLNSPSPSLLDAYAAIRSNGSFFRTLNKSLSLRIGRRFFLAGLIIESLQMKISNRAERITGLPMSIEVSINFSTVASYSREELFTAFYGTGFGTNSASITPSIPRQLSQR